MASTTRASCSGHRPRKGRAGVLMFRPRESGPSLPWRRVAHHGEEHRREPEGDRGHRPERAAPADGAGETEAGVIARPGPARAGTAPERLRVASRRLRHALLQSSRTYSKSTGRWSMPLGGGAIQLAKRPGSVTALGISERT